MRNCTNTRNGWFLNGVVLVLSVMVSASACANMAPTLEYRSLGAYDPGRTKRDKAVVDLARNNRNPSQRVIVLVDALPKGISLAHGTLQVEEGYQHQVLGWFKVTRTRASPIWFYPYRGIGRKALCYWQVPLTWITLGIWMIVPTSYPCWSKNSMPVDDAVQKAKAIAESAGGDLIAGTFLMKQGERVLGFVGIVIRVDPRFKEQPEKHQQRLPPARGVF